MSGGAIVGIAVLSACTAACLAVAVQSFRRKMRITTNPYMYMSAAEREREFAKIGTDGVNWLFRQQGTVFALCALLMLFLLLYTAVPVDFLLILVGITTAVLVVYSIASGVKSYKLTGGTIHSTRSTRPK